MLVKSLKIKNESIFYSNDMIQVNNFDSQLLKINKRENRENNNIYYISYKINKPEHNINSINNLCFVIDYLYGTIEKIDGSKDRYLVIYEDRLINKENIDLFYYLWNAIFNKIKYLRGDDVFDDNEVIIKDWNKIRFSSYIFTPNDVLVNFHSLVMVINCVIEKNYEFIPEIYIDEGYFEKVSYKMNKVRELKIDSELWAAPAKLVNLLDFKSKKLSIETESNANNDMKIHKNGGFYLTINNFRGYFNFNNNLGALTMLFDDINQQNKYYQVWKDIFKIIDRGHGELKLHEKIRLYYNDLPIKQVFKIPSITVVVKSLIEKNNKFYLELSISHCLYKL